MEGFVKENSEEKEMQEQEEPKFRQAGKKSKRVEKNMKEMEEPEKKRKWLIPAFIGSLIVIAIFCSTIFALVNINNDKIISGVSIAGVDVSGLTREEATAKIKNICQEKIDKEIEIQYQDYETTLNPTIMEVQYEVENAAEEAY